MHLIQTTLIFGANMEKIMQKLVKNIGGSYYLIDQKEKTTRTPIDHIGHYWSQTHYLMLDHYSKQEYKWSNIDSFNQKSGYEEKTFIDMIKDFCLPDFEGNIPSCWELINREKFIDNIFVQMIGFEEHDGKFSYTNGIIISLKDFLNGNYSEESNSDVDWIDRTSFSFLDYVPTPDTVMYNGEGIVISMEEADKIINRK